MWGCNFVTRVQQFWIILNYIKPFSLSVLFNHSLASSILVFPGHSWAILGYLGLSLTISAISGYLEFSRAWLCYLGLNQAILGYLRKSQAISIKFQASGCKKKQVITIQNFTFIIFIYCWCELCWSSHRWMAAYLRFCHFFFATHYMRSS